MVDEEIVPEPGTAQAPPRVLGSQGRRMAFPSLPLGGGRFTKPPMLIIALGGGVALALALLAMQFSQVQSLQQQLAQNRQVISRLEQDNQQLTQRITESETRRADLDKKLSALRGELASAGATLERGRVTLDDMQARHEDLARAHRELEAKFEAVSTERDATKRQAEALTVEKAELERSAVHLRERLALVERDFGKVRDQLTQLERAPRSDVAVVSIEGPSTGGTRTASAATGTTSIAGTVELPPIIVRKDQAGMTLPVRGRIVEANQPHNFIVLDQGSLDGVHVGMAFDLQRGGATVGRATVVRVRPNLAACDLVRAKTPMPPQVGDQAVQTGP